MVIVKITFFIIFATTSPSFHQAAQLQGSVLLRLDLPLLSLLLPACRSEDVKAVLKQEYPQGIDIIYEVCAGSGAVGCGAAREA